MTDLNLRQRLDAHRPLATGLTADAGINYPVLYAGLYALADQLRGIAAAVVDRADLLAANLRQAGFATTAGSVLDAVADLRQAIT